MYLGLLGLIYQERNADGTEPSYENQRPYKITTVLPYTCGTCPTKSYLWAKLWSLKRADCIRPFAQNDLSQRPELDHSYSKEMRGYLA